MQVRLDRDRCQGHGRCYTLAPDVFDEDEAGRCVLVVSTVPSEHHEAARRGVEACPEYALSIVDTEASEA